MNPAIPPHLDDRWPCFQLLDTRRATWTELTEKMSMNDVLDVIEALNVLGRSSNRAEMSPEEYDDYEGR